MTALKTQKTVFGPCIWMQAGLVPNKPCTHYFDCATCRFDRAMNRNAAAGKHLSWQEALRCHDSQDRTCRHALVGRTRHRACPMNYNCSRCDFDQALEEVFTVRALPAGAPGGDIKGFALPSGHFFHVGHTWARLEPGGFIRVGMDDFAMKVLGPPDRLELPLTGQELNQGKTGWDLGRKGYEAGVRAPVDGVICAVNPDPVRSPGHLAQDPYGRGWLFTVHHPHPRKALEALLDEETGAVWLDSEISDLEQMVEETIGPMATDGGLFMPDVFGALPALGWDNLTRRFLGT